MSFHISKDAITKYAQRYDGRYLDKHLAIENELLNWLKENRYLNREKFIKLGHWKSPRAIKQYSSPINTEDRVKSITTFSLASTDDFIRVMPLLTLTGVSWPVASVILHFAFPNEYMIMDFRVLESLGWKKPSSYDFDFWMHFTNEIRKITIANEVSPRTLDKALWQYSKEQMNTL